MQIKPRWDIFHSRKLFLRDENANLWSTLNYHWSLIEWEPEKLQINCELCGIGDIMQFISEWADNEMIFILLCSSR